MQLYKSLCLLSVCLSDEYYTLYLPVFVCSHLEYSSNICSICSYWKIFFWKHYNLNFLYNKIFKILWILLPDSIFVLMLVINIYGVQLPWSEEVLEKDVLRKRCSFTWNKTFLVQWLQGTIEALLLTWPYH